MRKMIGLLLVLVLATPVLADTTAPLPPGLEPGPDGHYWVFVLYIPSVNDQPSRLMVFPFTNWYVCDNVVATAVLWVMGVPGARISTCQPLVIEPGEWVRLD